MLDRDFIKTVFKSIYRFSEAQMEQLPLSKETKEFLSEVGIPDCVELRVVELNNTQYLPIYFPYQSVPSRSEIHFVAVNLASDEIYNIHLEYKTVGYCAENIEEFMAMLAKNITMCRDFPDDNEDDPDWGSEEYDIRLSAALFDSCVQAAWELYKINPRALNEYSYWISLFAALLDMFTPYDVVDYIAGGVADGKFTSYNDGLTHVLIDRFQK